MKSSILAPLILMAPMGFLGLASAQQPELGEPGWTGVSNPEDVIAARRALMIETERLMRSIDTYAVEGSGDPAALRETADAVASMLRAVPHLFPPTTDVYDAADEIPGTLALPAIWQDFTGFYGLAAAASNAAARMALATEASALREAARGLRASCDACHALYMKPYAPTAVTREDLEFDFESVFPSD